MDEGVICSRAGRHAVGASSGCIDGDPGCAVGFAGTASAFIVDKDVWLSMRGGYGSGLRREDLSLSLDYGGDGFWRGRSDNIIYTADFLVPLGQRMAFVRTWIMIAAASIRERTRRSGVDRDRSIVISIEFFRQNAIIQLDAISYRHCARSDVGQSGI